jgi:plastocyanin domain-containing protein
MTALLVNLTGITVIGLIVWWFWASNPKDRETVNNGVVEIMVKDGVYTPATIEAQAGKPIVLRFIRRDPGPCAEKVIFADLGLSADLPVEEPQEIIVTTDKPGEYDFTCQMGMYRGVLIIK